jgi:hypothetical protein
MHPGWLDAARWRQVVLNVPGCVAYRDTLIMNVMTLDWRVVSRVPEDAWQYRSEIDWYTKLFRDIDDEGYDIHTEKVLKDCYDIPFGGASEVGRSGDSPTGRAKWVRHIDGGTLYPTQNVDFPVAQFTPYMVQVNPILFPSHTVVRTYLSPRTEIERRGWGMAPPERAYLAVEMLYRGDRYYADLFLDVPEVGVLDLGDMEEESAKSWVESWRNLLTGPGDSFKIPVLYGHTTKADFISFTRPPTEMMFDKGLEKYLTLVGAAYGLSPSDIGDTTMGARALASSLRQERHAKQTGVGTAILKTQAYYTRILPSHLRFEMISRDEELLVARGRARLANSMGLGNLVDKKIILPSHALDQMVSDGLITIPVQEWMEELTEAEKAIALDLNDPTGLKGGSDLEAGSNGQNSGVGASTKPKQVARETMQDPKPPSKGGQGEIIAQSDIKRLVNIARTALRGLVEGAREEISNGEDTAVNAEVSCAWVEQFSLLIYGKRSVFDGVPVVVNRCEDARASVIRSAPVDDEHLVSVVLFEAANSLFSGYGTALAAVNVRRAFADRGQQKELEDETVQAGGSTFRSERGSEQQHTSGNVGGSVVGGDGEVGVGFNGSAPSDGVG